MFGLYLWRRFAHQGVLVGGNVEIEVDHGTRYLAHHREEAGADAADQLLTDLEMRFNFERKH